jgi:choline dehydrogenase-like flavoprotein
MYENFVAADSQAGERLIPQYIGIRPDFDIVIIGSGVGGGVLADNLAERLGGHARILVLEAGSFLYPTHVYNICRFHNYEVARKFGCATFWQQGDSPANKLYIGEQPQLNFGGRSIFWSGLIPALQKWELHFFPPGVREDLVEHPNPLKRDERDLLHRAGEKMNQSRSMGRVAQQVVKRLQNSWVAADFYIDETPRALHQPYLKPDGTPANKFFTEPTGVFNTAELLINQLGLNRFGLTPGASSGNGPGLYLLLNHFVEDVQDCSDHLELVVRNTLTGQPKTFQASKVVLAGGSIESPKLLRRSSIYRSLDDNVKDLVGRGLTDHPTTDSIDALVDGIGGIDLDENDHAKIIFYSRGLLDQNSDIRYPFNVEMNINHEYWHLRRNDPADPDDPKSRRGKARIDIKFSFGNCLDDDNEVKPSASHLPYVPEIVFHNTELVERLAESRFPALAGWKKTPSEIWDVLNDITRQIFSLFRLDGKRVEPKRRYGEHRFFGYGTVHHAVGSLRMPWRPRYGQEFSPDSVVDQDLKVVGTERLYVCDMSVMPVSTAANPVRALVALALRLSRDLETELTKRST